MMKKFSSAPCSLPTPSACHALSQGTSRSSRHVYGSSPSSLMRRTSAATSSCGRIALGGTGVGGLTSSSSMNNTNNSSNMLSTLEFHNSQRRFNASFLMSNTKSPIQPYKGYVNDAVSMRPSHRCGGGRGVFAERVITYDTQIMKVEAFKYHVSTEPYQMQSRQILRHVLAELAVGGKMERDWIRKNIFMMTVGGPPAFESEEDCQRFIARTPGGPKLTIEGEIDAEDVQKLAMQLEYNRFPIEYGGEQGVACIPEASLFNHSCEPNASLEVKMDPQTQNFYASVRTLRPVKPGEELYINYMPEGLDLPLTRFVGKMKVRWGFECRCGVCKTRTIAMCAVFLVVFMGPVLVPFLLAITDRIKKKHAY